MGRPTTGVLVAAAATITVVLASSSTAPLTQSFLAPHHPHSPAGEVNLPPGAKKVPQKRFNPHNHQYDTFWGAGAGFMPPLPSYYHHHPRPTGE